MDICIPQEYFCVSGYNVLDYISNSDVELLIRRGNSGSLIKQLVTDFRTYGSYLESDHIPLVTKLTTPAENRPRFRPNKPRKTHRHNIPLKVKV